MILYSLLTKEVFIINKLMKKADHQVLNYLTVAATFLMGFIDAYLLVLL